MLNPATNSIPAEPAMAGYDEQFMVGSRLEITHILHAIMREASTLTVTLGANDFFLTSILAIDENADCMFVERGRSQPPVSSILKARTLLYSTTLDKVRIRFACEGIEAVDYAGMEAYRIPLPADLARIQRREYFRITTPIITPVKCRISTDETADDARVELTICDISCSGIAVRSPPAIFTPELGTCYMGVIQIPAMPSLRTMIQARNAFMITLADGKIAQRLGFTYVNPLESMVATIQRYILSLERLHMTRRARRLDLT